MAERWLFLTGHLAKTRLEKLLAQLGSVPFEPVVLDIGVKVAALMTQAIIARRLPQPLKAEKVIVPGRCRADLDALTAHFGVAFVRGPDELQDLPAFLGRGGKPRDLSRHDVRIFAEIVDASGLEISALVARAQSMRAAGADVIDLGCLPDTPFAQLETCIAALHAAGLKVSVDSADAAELQRGAQAGADYLLSLTEHNLDLAASAGAVPILIPATHGDLASLLRAADKAAAMGLPCILDPILDPIHFGFTESLGRYAQLRRLRPDAEIMMGTGNLTELTEADSVGITATLMGVCSELAIRNVLVVHVSPHTRRTIQEHDGARRLMFAAREDASLPKGYGAGLLQLHDVAPFAATPQEIGELAGAVRDANFRIEVASDGVHVFNRHGHHVAGDAFSLYPSLGVEADGAHAFYLGAELMKAELAHRLGKRYAQDEPLDFGCGTDRADEDRTRLKAIGHTLRAATPPET